MTKKYVFLDIDGTLVDYSGRIGERGRRALSAARENGHRLILAPEDFTVRFTAGCFVCPFDGSHPGGAVRLDGRTVFTHYFPGDN